MTDPRDEVVLRLSHSYAWVRPFAGFVFVCGGAVDAKSATPVSVRDALLRSVGSKRPLSDRIRLAEEFKDWAVDGHYSNLLKFEEHLAELSDLVILILESPGALAELGLFSASQIFHDKLVVYVSTHHFNQPSFIRLGPIRMLELNDNAAEVFPWIRNNGWSETVDTEWLARSGHELLDSLEDRLSRDGEGESRFDKERWLHRVLLVCNLMWLMSALTIKEISGYLALFGINFVESELRQALFILEKLELISVVARSRSRFYVANRDSDFVRWGVQSSEVDLERFQMDVVRYYERSDKRRFRALQEARV